MSLSAKEARRRDRRTSPRFRLRADISFKILKLPPPPAMVKLLDTMRPASSRDLSKEGAGFISRQLLLPGTIIDLHLPRTRILRARRMRAKVVWVREVNAGRYQIGVKFL